jgi:hypothetical protein
MVNAFDYVTFMHRLTWDLPGKFWKKREVINFHNYWFLIWPIYFIDRSEIPPIIIDFDDDESSDEESWIQSNMITDWTGTPAVNDRLYITFLLVEVPEKAIVPFMVNAFDYVTFMHMLTWDLPRKFWKKLEIINFHNYWFLIWPSYFIERVYRL